MREESPDLRDVVSRRRMVDSTKYTKLTMGSGPKLPKEKKHQGETDALGEMMK